MEFWEYFAFNQIPKKIDFIRPVNSSFSFHFELICSYYTNFYQYLD